VRCEIFPGVHLIGSGRFRYTHATNCNIYAVVGQHTTALIDTGSGFGTRSVLDSLENHGIAPGEMALALHTHSDWDHARGACAIARATGCTVAIHELGRERLESGPWLGVGQPAPPEVTFEPVDVGMVLQDELEIDLGGRLLRVLHTPGHSPDSVCFELNLEGRRILFSGDTVEAAGKPGISTASTDFGAYRDSVLALAEREIDALLPGHGLFVLEEAGDHIRHLADKLSSKWVDVAALPYPPPFDSAVWYYQSHPELLRE
jgi:glyoxylase-like metal-dependent hydrolase (beta-lactamase superfamily II)